MNYGSDSGPLCNFCGRKLSRNELSGQYECLSCTFQRMESDDAIEVETSSGNQQNYYESPAQQEYQELLKIKAFQEHLHSSAPGLIVTKILIAINILVYIYVSTKGNNFSSPSSLLLLEMGANNGEKVFSGEWWRLFNSMFLHGGLTHIAFNMYALWAIGSIVEKLFGSFGYFIIYMVSGIMGNILSLYNHSAFSVGVGASGAVFGIFGALVAFAYFKNIPKQIAGGILKNAGLMILINGAIGLSIPQIDNSAHIGGCLGGIVTAYFIGQDLTKLNKSKRKITSVIVAVACFLFVYLSWGFVKDKNLKNEDPRIQMLEKEQQEIDKIIVGFNKAEKIKEKDVQLLIDKFKNQEVSSDEAISILEKDYIKFFKKEGEALRNALNKDFVKPEWKKYTKEYMKLYMSFWDLYKKYFETSDTIYLSQAKLMKMKVDGLRPEDFR